MGAKWGECKKWEGNAEGDAGNAGNKCVDAENKGGNLGVAVETAKSSSVNNKFKKWRKVKIIEKSIFVKI